MPLPTPDKNDTESTFLQKCMSDETMNKDFPDQKQRAAVCYSQFRKKDEKKEKAAAFDLKIKG